MFINVEKVDSALCPLPISRKAKAILKFTSKGCFPGEPLTYSLKGEEKKSSFQSHELQSNSNV